MKNDLFITAGEVSQDLGGAIPFAYKRVRQMNEDLEEADLDMTFEKFVQTYECEYAEFLM